MAAIRYSTVYSDDDDGGGGGGMMEGRVGSERGVTRADAGSYYFIRGNSVKIPSVRIA